MLAMLTPVYSSASDQVTAPEILYPSVSLTIAVNSAVALFAPVSGTWIVSASVFTVIVEAVGV